MMTQFLLQLVLSAGLAASPSVPFEGTVLDPAGEPVPGAVVVLHQGKLDLGHGTTCGYITPEVGENTGSYCAMCQVDRGHATRTDAEGKFYFEELHPDYRHMLAVTAPGLRSLFTFPVDVKTESMTVRLEPQPEMRRRPGHVLKGIVTDETGTPIANATVLPVGIRTEKGTRWRTRDVEKVTLTDDYGRFRIASDTAPAELHLRVRSKNHAPRVVRLPLGNEEEHRIVLRDGVTLRGRIPELKRQEAKVGVVGAERHPSLFLGERFATVEPDGSFELRHLAPGRAYVLFTPIQGEGLRSLPATWLRLPADRDVVDLGRQEMLRTFRVSGRVFVDGEDPPEGLYLLVTRTSAWDMLEIPVAGDGGFSFRIPPGETIRISVKLEDHSFAPDTVGFNPFDPWQLTGRVDDNVNGYRIRLVQGLQHERDAGYRERVGRPQWPESRSLARGVKRARQK